MSVVRANIEPIEPRINTRISHQEFRCGISGSSMFPIRTSTSQCIVHPHALPGANRPDRSERHRRWRQRICGLPQRQTRDCLVSKGRGARRETTRFYWRRKPRRIEYSCATVEAARILARKLVAQQLETNGKGSYLRLPAGVRIRSYRRRPASNNQRTELNSPWRGLGPC